MALGSWTEPETTELATLVREHGDAWREHLADFPLLAGRTRAAIGHRIGSRQRAGDPRFFADPDHVPPPWPKRDAEAWPDTAKFFHGRDSRRAEADRGTPRDDL